MPHNALAAILQLFIGKTGDKGISFRFQRFRQHSARTFAGELCKRIHHHF